MFAEGLRQPGGVDVSYTARDGKGSLWFVDVAGSFTSHRAGLRRTDTLWKAIGKAALLRQLSSTPLVLLTAEAPARGSAGAVALERVTGARSTRFAPS